MLSHMQGIWNESCGITLSPLFSEGGAISISIDIASIWKTCMMTSSKGNIFRVTCPLCGEFTDPGEFPTKRPVTRSFDVFFDLRLNKRLSKQLRDWWFETQSWSLWRHGNVNADLDYLLIFICKYRQLPDAQCYINMACYLWLETWDVVIIYTGVTRICVSVQRMPIDRTTLSPAK